ncbi:MAG: phosphate butyryltransferase, partial [Candidatus Hydrothermota bacterium]
DVAAGNSLAKSMIYFGGAKAGGIILGAKAPVVLLSRADSPEQKLYSIAFALASL